MSAGPERPCGLQVGTSMDTLALINNESSLICLGQHSLTKMQFLGQLCPILQLISRAQKTARDGPPPRDENPTRESRQGFGRDHVTVPKSIK